MPIQYLSKSLFLKTALLLLCLVISSILCPMAIDHSNLANDQDTINNSNILYFPAINPGKGLQTTVSITNTECKCKQKRANVTLTAYDKEGSQLGIVPAISHLGAGKIKTLNARTFPSDTKSLKIESDGNLIGNTIFKTKDGTKLEVVPAVKEPSQQLDFPALASYDDIYIYETITLLNPNRTPASVDIIALDKDGYEIDRNTLSSLSSMESRDITLIDIFNGSTLKNLPTVRVISDNDIVGFQLVDYPEVDLVGLPALTTTSKAWTFPIVKNGEHLDLWTKVGILNPGNDIAYFTVEAFDSSNNSLGIIYNQKLFPGATYFLSTENANIVDRVISLNTAFLKVTSDQPISSYEIIGVLEGNGLTAAHGIPGEDQTTVGFEITGSNDGEVLNAYPMVRFEDGGVKSMNGSFGDIKVAKRLLIAKDEKKVSITSKSPFPSDKITSSFAADYSGPAPAAGDEASEIAWAKARREWLLKRMKTDLQAVVDEAFSKIKLMKMPKYMQPYLEKRKTVKGTLEIMIMDNFEEGISKTLYYLKTREGERYALHFTGKMPHLRSGLRIRIRNGIILDKHIAVPAPTDKNLQAHSRTPRLQYAIGAVGQRKVAVILFNFQNNTDEPFTKEEVREKVYDDANDYYKEVSFSKLSISGYNSSTGEQDIYGWYTIPYNSAPDCETGDWSYEANKLAVKQDNFNENNYSNIMYFFPYNNNCDFAGTGVVGNLSSNYDWPVESWFNGGIGAYIIAHELGHNFGSQHASSYKCYDENKNTVSISDDCDFSDYGDPFDVMGSGSSPNHMSSFNKTQLGWLDSQNVQNVEEDGTFTLYPIEKKSSGIQAIKIPRGTYSESTYYDDYYFLEYRRPYGYDDFNESDAVVNGISIRLVKSYYPEGSLLTYLIDTTPGSNPNDYANDNDFIDSALLSGETFKDDIANIEIKTISVSDESAEVEIKTSYVKKCLREDPSISIYPYSQSIQAGNTAQYTVTIINNDDETTCENSTFNITSTLPADLSQSPSSFKMTLNPGKTQTQIITIATNAAENGSYEFTETAVNESAAEYQQSATAKLYIIINSPETPANFKAQTGECGSKSIELTWNDVENESYYKLGRQGSDGDETITISQNITSYIDKNVKEGYTYYYELKACNNSGCSDAIPAGPVEAPSECQIFKTLTIERKGSGLGKITITNKSDNNQKGICDLSSKDSNKCEFQYPEKSKLKLQAQPSSGSVFKKWIGGCSETSKTCNITLTSDTTVMAKFAAKNKKQQSKKGQIENFWMVIKK